MRNNQSSKIHINFFEELIKAAFTGIVLLLFSTLISWLVYMNSPGEYTGDKLKNYFAQTICKKIKCDINIDEFLVSEDGITLICFNSSNSNNGEYNNGIFLFERKDKNFWNVLFGTEPSYKVIADYVSEDKLDYNSASFRDIDDNHDQEIILEYSCQYATRVSEITIVLQKQNDKWELIEPDLSNIEAELAKQQYYPAKILIDKYDFYEGQTNKSYSAYGLSHGGAIIELENPFYNGMDWLYIIVTNDGSTGMISSNDIVLKMQRVTDNGFHNDFNWNGGNALCIGKYDENTFYEIIENKWGIQIDGMFFYGLDE